MVHDKGCTLSSAESTQCGDCTASAIHMSLKICCREHNLLEAGNEDVVTATSEGRARRGVSKSIRQQGVPGESDQESAHKNVAHAKRHQRCHRPLARATQVGGEPTEMGIEMVGRLPRLSFLWDRSQDRTDLPISWSTSISLVGH